jgi:hypothetical protein
MICPPAPVSKLDSRHTGRLAYGRERKGWAWNQIIRRRERLVLCYNSILSASHSKLDPSPQVILPVLLILGGVVCTTSHLLGCTGHHKVGGRTLPPPAYPQPTLSEITTCPPTHFYFPLLSGLVRSCTLVVQAAL